MGNTATRFCSVAATTDTVAAATATTVTATTVTATSSLHLHSTLLWRDHLAEQQLSLSHLSNDLWYMYAKWCKTNFICNRATKYSNEETVSIRLPTAFRLVDGSLFPLLSRLYF